MSPLADLACRRLGTVQCRPFWHPHTATHRSTRPNVATWAKKKGSGGGKGGKQPKVSALDKIMSKAKQEAPKVESGTEGSTAEYNSPEVMMLLLVLASSYTQATKKYLMEDVDFEQLATALYGAPFGLIVHDKYSDEEPVITYANKAALSVLGAEWADVIGTASSQFAPAEKDSFLGPQSSKAASNSVTETWLQSKSGKLLKVKDGLIFDVSSMADEKLGQALRFSTVENDAGQVMVLDPAEAAALEQLKVPTAEDVASAQAAVEEQAAVVRELKDGKGLTNQDQEVKDAVAELLKRKEHASQLQKRLSLEES